MVGSGLEKALIPPDATVVSVSIIFFNFQFFKIYFKLEVNCFTVLYWFLLHNNMNQP